MRNLVILLGRVGKIEQAFTQSGTEVSNLSLATNKKIKDKSTGNYEEKTSWHRLKVFGSTAKFLNEYVTKGSMLYVEGELDYGKYEKDGVTHYTTDIFVNKAEIASKPKDEQ